MTEVFVGLMIVAAAAIAFLWIRSKLKKEAGSWGGSGGSWEGREDDERDPKVE